MKIAQDEVSVCLTCAERGRPNEPVYKIGMCEFCYRGSPHPKATSEELRRERTGTSRGNDPVDKLQNEQTRRLVTRVTDTRTGCC